MNLNEVVACGNHGACGGLGKTRESQIKPSLAQPLINGLMTCNQTILYSPQKIRELFFTHDKPDAALAFPLTKAIPEKDRLTFLIQTKQTLANLWAFLKQALPLNADAQKEFKQIESKIVFA